MEPRNKNPKVPLLDNWNAFVGRKKETSSEDTCTSCHQPLPGKHPYRSTVSPTEESDPGAVSQRLSAGVEWLKAHTPAPMKWMFRSIAWIVVGAAVVSIALVAAYFIGRYLLWYLILALGKWILDKIGAKLPPHIWDLNAPADYTGHHTAQLIDTWAVGLGAICMVAILYRTGKALLPHLLSNK